MADLLDSSPRIVSDTREINAAADSIQGYRSDDRFRALFVVVKSDILLNIIVWCMEGYFLCVITQWRALDAQKSF